MIFLFFFRSGARLRFLNEYTLWRGIGRITAKRCCPSAWPDEDWWLVPGFALAGPGGRRNYHKIYVTGDRPQNLRILLCHFLGFNLLASDSFGRFVLIFTCIPIRGQQGGGAGSPSVPRDPPAPVLKYYSEDRSKSTDGRGSCTRSTLQGEPSMTDLADSRLEWHPVLSVTGGWHVYSFTWLTLSQLGTKFLPR